MVTKTIITAALMLIGFSAGAQQKAYHLTGRISGWRGTDTLVLWQGDSPDRKADTTVVQNGVFKFTGTAELPVKAVLARISNASRSGRDTRTFYMDSGMTRVSGTDSLRTAVLKGAKLTADYEALASAIDPMMKRLVQLRMSAMKTPKAEQQSPGFKALEKEYMELLTAISEAKIKFIMAHPNSLVSLHTLSQMLSAQIDYPKYWPVYQALSPAMKLRSEGRELGKRLETAKYTALGTQLPDFSSLDTLRQPLSLSDVVKKGKVTLVDFWASWCAPCRAENPNVVKAYHAFHDKGFNILSVSLDKDAVSWKKAIIKDGMPWYHVSGLRYWDEPVAKMYGINGVPDSFLLDAKGRVVARGLRGEALYNKILSMLQ